MVKYGAIGSEMWSAGRKALKARRDLVRFSKLSDERRKIVFYSEGRNYWKYFEAVIQHLLSMGEYVSYLTSDFSDPILEGDGHQQLDAFYIGNGALRTVTFRLLKARVVVLTMPDLNSFHIKRSSAYDVHYVYLHHSPVSTHMIYREGAFDHFDSILCVGPHHEAEIRAWEALRKLPPKGLYEHGYGPIDNLIAVSKATTNRSGHNAGKRIKTLIAPSWGDTCILERGARPLVNSLLEAGHNVTVRPHPRTWEVSRKTVVELDDAFRDNTNFRLESEPYGFQTLIDADVMISDWSGAAMEFAFGLGRPVLFVDQGRKVRNSAWSKVGITPLEELYRSEVGMILEGSRVGEAARLVRELSDRTVDIALRAEMQRKKWVFNPGASGKAGAEIIQRLAN